MSNFLPLSPGTKAFCQAGSQLWARELPDGDWFVPQQRLSEVSCGGLKNEIEFTQPWLTPWVPYEVACREYTQSGPGMFSPTIGPLMVPLPEPSGGLLAGVLFVLLLRRMRR